MSTLEALRTRPAAASPVASNPYLEGNYAPIASETTAFDLKVYGHVPEELEGRFVRIGPNPVGLVDPARHHWFTGTGMAHGLRLRGGKAEWYRSRYIVGEQVASALGRANIPGPVNGFGAGSPNTNLVRLGDRDYAVVEAGGLPVELSYDLESIARSNLESTLPHGFSAHPKLDPLTGEQHVMTYQPGLQAISYVLIDPAGKARVVAEIPAPDCPMIHDVAFTATSVIVLDLPVTFDMPTAMSGSPFPFRWRRDRTPRVGLLPRDGDLSRLQWIEVPACYVFHVMNAYDAEETVVMDVVRHDRVFDADLRGPSEGAPKLMRWVLDRATGGFSETQLSDEGCEFPRLNDAFGGQAYRYGYTAGSSEMFFGAAHKHDVRTARTEVHDFGPGRSGLEPVFVPRADAKSEDDGWVMAYVYDENRGASDVEIIDAKAFCEGPVARIELPVRVPYGFHGNWLPDLG